MIQNIFREVARSTFGRTLFAIGAGVSLLMSSFSAEASVAHPQNPVDTITRGQKIEINELTGFMYTTKLEQTNTELKSVEYPGGTLLQSFFYGPVDIKVIEAQKLGTNKPAYVAVEIQGDKGQFFRYEIGHDYEDLTFISQGARTSWRLLDNGDMRIDAGSFGEDSLKNYRGGDRLFDSGRLLGLFYISKAYKELDPAARPTGATSKIEKMDNVLGG